MSFFENDTAFAAFLREHADKHRMFASDKVWYGIQEQVHGRKRWPALGIVGFGVLLLTILFTVALSDDSLINTYKKLPNSPTRFAVSSLPISPATNRNFLRQVQTVQGLQFPLHTNTFAVSEEVHEELLAMNTRTTGTTEAHHPTANVIAREENELNPLEEYIPASLSTISIGELPASTSAFGDKLAEEAPTPTEAPLATEGLENNNKNHWATVPAVGKPKPKKWSVGFNIAGGSSFRNLYANSSNAASFITIPLAANLDIDVNEAAKHTPGFGMEASALFGYQLNSTIKFLAGLQYNYRKYNIAVSGYSFDATRLQLANASAITLAGQYSNVGNYHPLTISNSLHEISIPLCVQVNLLQGKKMAWVMDAFVQPTHVLDKAPFTLSTDFKSYVNGSPLLRNWNINTAIGTHLQIKSGSTTWQLGPQFRYQQLPTYKDAYPVKEHLY
ncbi:MAG: hypothetical protein EAY68_03200, partial [Bacteroidetes bacterium]